MILNQNIKEPDCFIQILLNKNRFNRARNSAFN